jgi:rhamnulokinase
MSTGAVAAVDLGATSGRVIIGHVGPNELRLEHIARFPNTPVTSAEKNGSGLHWDIAALHRDVRAGLAAAGRAVAARSVAERTAGRLASIGIDTWAVDYALLAAGSMIGTPFHYRDERTASGVSAVHAAVPFNELYAQNGLQFLPFNTLYQLVVDRDAGLLEHADAVLLIPDLFAYWLTGELVAEQTNASTTGLLSVGDDGTTSGTPDGGSGAWNDALIERIGLPRRLFPQLVSPGTTIGPLMPEVADELGYQTSVTAVGSHDTASAVVAVPMTTTDAAYISCGTWGLVGVELERPVLTDASRAANFTNEGGVDGRTRFLHNVMGLWLLSESMRTWERSGLHLELPRLLAEAAALTTPVPIFDANDPRFLAPGDMPARIAEWCREHDQPVPHAPVTFARSILESLANAFAEAVHTAARLSGTSVRVIHMVGGGSLNHLLCQLTADSAGLPVLAGPVEATAIGNVLVQARTAGLVDGDLETLRSLVARTHEPARFEPRMSAARASH